MKTATEMKAEYSPLLDHVFPDRATLHDSIEGTALFTTCLSGYREHSLSLFDDWPIDLLRISKEEYEESNNPFFYRETTDEEIVVAWQPSEYVEDVIENIIGNYITDRSYYFRAPSSESITVEYMHPSYDFPMEYNLTEYGFYKIEKLTPSVPESVLYKCGFPQYVAARDHKYLTRNGARVDKLRAAGVPLKALRYRPVNELGYYERLAIIARKIEEEGQIFVDSASQTC